MLRAGLASSEIEYLNGAELFESVISGEVDVSPCDGVDIDGIESIEELGTDINEDDSDICENEDTDFSIENFQLKSLKQTASLISPHFDVNSCTKIIRQRFQSIVLPSPFSQGGLNNGSSACTVISIISGFVFSQPNLELDLSLSSLTYPYLGCIDLGNSIHTESHFLYVHEALTMLPMLELQIVKETNFYSEAFSSGVIDLFTTVENSSFVTITFLSKSMSIVKLSSRYFLFDSHCHQPETGASIYTCMNEDLDLMRNWMKIPPGTLLYGCTLK